VPVVTLPGRFMRARQSAAMLTLAGATELVARDENDYVEIASRIAGDAAFANEMAQRLSTGRARVFDDPAPLAALSAWLLENG